MKHLVPVGALLACFLFTACTDVQIATVERIACRVDAIVQPVGAMALEALLPSTAGGVELDKRLVHPVVVEFCRKLNGVPVIATVQVKAP